MLKSIYGERIFINLNSLSSKDAFQGSVEIKTYSNKNWETPTRIPSLREILQGRRDPNADLNAQKEKCGRPNTVVPLGLCLHEAYILERAGWTNRPTKHKCTLTAKFYEGEACDTKKARQSEIWLGKVRISHILATFSAVPRPHVDQGRGDHRENHAEYHWALSARVHSLLLVSTVRNAESSIQVSSENRIGPSLGHKQLWLKEKGHTAGTQLPRPSPVSCLQIPGAS